MNFPTETEEEPPDSPSAPSRLDCIKTGEPQPHHPWPDITPSKMRDWRWQRSSTLKSIEHLSLLLDLRPHQIAEYKRLIEIYHYAVTPYYFSLINQNDPDDPVKKQAFPDLKELEMHIVGDSDPLEEDKFMPVPGLVHRYPDRVLAVITNICAMYCRHCTRKRIWRKEAGTATMNELASMVQYVKKSPGIREVIVSGGDPLTVKIDVLDWFLGELRMISHLEVIRIGTRIPVVLPMRINDDLVKMLARHRPLWINTQFNHPREITPESREACDRLLRAGIPVSNQSVLLKGINDSVTVMRELCHALQRIMVRPYYLFQCDPVRGVEHFRTSIWKGIEIIESMQGHTGGLSIPKYVVDAPGGGGKIPLQPFYLLSASDREILMRNYEGKIIRYYNPNDINIPGFGNSGERGNDTFADRNLPEEHPQSNRRIKRKPVALCKGGIH